MSDSLVFDWLTAEDVADAFEIEQLGYPPDEAASLSTLISRQSITNDLFLGAYSTSVDPRSPPSPGRQLIGFVCSTLSTSKSLTHESMSHHVPTGSSICIHSVCIAPAYRRKGIGSKLMKEYISKLERQRSGGSATYERVLLIAHEELRTFYEKAGFQWIGKSAVVHGSRPWYEMRRLIGDPSPSPSEANLGSAVADQTPLSIQSLPPALLEALQRPSSNRPAPQLLSSFPNGISDVIISDPATTPTNKYDLLCPRSECGSVILKAGLAKWVERSSVQLEPSELSPHPILPELPTPPTTAQWWLVMPSPMIFENIGFSRPVLSNQWDAEATSKSLKLLTCAECDLGPLGWCEVGGSEFWIACSRVGYRQQVLSR